MTSKPPEFATYRWSTDDCPEQDRLAYWCEVLGRQVLRIDMEAPSEALWRADLTLRTLPELNMISGVCSESCYRRTRGLVADGNSDFGLVWYRAGGGIVAGRGREVPLQPGNALLLSWAEAHAVKTLWPSRFAGLAIPHTALAPLVTNADDTVMRVIPGTEALRLLTGYVGLLTDNQGLATPELRRIAVAHVHDLAALAIGASRDAAAAAEGRGVRAARLSAIKADIAENLGRQDLSVVAVAVRQGIRPRYIQRLFETEGTTFSQFVLAQRLHRAHRMLTGPRFAGWKISAIAFEAGFADLSYFNRAFRRRFAVSPSDVREAARGSIGAS